MEGLQDKRKKEIFKKPGFALVLGTESGKGLGGFPIM